MGIQFVRGDLFLLQVPALAHGCNCAGAMGKGIAVEFRKRWPNMYEAYREASKDGSFRPGDVLPWRADNRVVYNLGTEEHWRKGARLEFIEQSVREMLRQAEAEGISAIGLPRLGAGHGKLPWSQVRGLLTQLAAASPVELVVVEDFEPGMVPIAGES